MANIRVAYALSSILLATPAAATISASVDTYSVSAAARPETIIKASAFVVPMEYLEEQTVTMSDFRTFSIDKVLIDVVTMSDANNVAFDITATAVDSVAIVENSIKIFSGTIDFDPSDPDTDPDPINIADADVKAIGKTLTEATTAADTDAKTVDKVSADAITSTDTINQKDVDKSLTDTTAAADTINQFNTSKVVADSATITDAAAKELTRPDVADTTTVADDSSRQPGLDKTDSVTAADSFGPFNIGKNPSDSVTASEAIGPFTIGQALSDSVTMTDVVVKTPAYVFDYDTVDADADPDPVTVTEVMAKDFTRPNITDTASVTDTAAKDVTRPDVADSVTGTDSPVFSTAKVLTDSVTGSEAIVLSPVKVLTDSATATDAVNTFAIGKYVTDSITATDAINLFSISKVLADSVTMAESISTTLVLGQTTPICPDYVSMADGNGFVFHRFRTIVEDYTEVLGNGMFNAEYIQGSSDSVAYENYTGLIGGPGLLLTAPLISGEFITYADTSGAGLVVNFHYTDAADRTVGGYYFNQTPIL